jgi:hypothetical protein
MLLDMAVIHRRSMFGASDEKQSYWSFPLLNNLRWLGIVSGYDGEYCFPSCPYGDSFPVRGAPPHFYHRVSAFLDREFSDRRTEEGTYSLALRCTDLTPQDFFFWGFIKDVLYRRKSKMRTRCVTNEMLASTWRETEYRLDVCRATKRCPYWDLLST